MTSTLRAPINHASSAGDMRGDPGVSERLSPATARSSLSSVTTPPPPYSKSNSMARRRINSYYEMIESKNDEIIPRPKSYYVVNDTGEEPISPVTPKSPTSPFSNPIGLGIRRKPVPSQLSTDQRPPSSGYSPMGSNSPPMEHEQFPPDTDELKQVVSLSSKGSSKGKRPSRDADTFKEVAFDAQVSAQHDYAKLPIPAVESEEPASYIDLMRKRNQSRAKRKTSKGASG